MFSNKSFLAALGTTEFALFETTGLSLNDNVFTVICSPERLSCHSKRLYRHLMPSFALFLSL